MKAITLHQPYATFIATGKKRVETRSWPPPASVIGQRIAIQAGRHFDGRSRVVMRYFFPMHDIEKVPDGKWVEGSAIRVTPHAPRSQRLFFPLGCIVATANLIGAGRVVGHHRNAAILYDRRGECPLAVPIDDFGYYEIGRWCFILKHVEPHFGLPPARGYQGFWEWTDG